MMWWNGEPLPTPSPGISFEERIVEGTNSGQTLGGSYSKKIIARKEDVRVTWEGLTAEESAAIGKIDASTYGKLTYYSPSKGKFLTKTMHVESHTQTQLWLRFIQLMFGRQTEPIIVFSHYLRYNFRSGFFGNSHSLLYAGQWQGIPVY